MSRTFPFYVLLTSCQFPGGLSQPDFPGASQFRSLPETGMNVTAFIMWLVLGIFVAYIIYKITASLIEKLSVYFLKENSMKLVVKGSATAADANAMLLDPILKTLTIQKSESGIAITTTIEHPELKITKVTGHE